MEAAFGIQDDELVGLISGYEPAQQLGFSEQELKRLLVLRGRASRANSKAGIEEINTVNTAVSEKLLRCKRRSNNVPQRR